MNPATVYIFFGAACLVVAALIGLPLAYFGRVR
jgi:hypothetical protein